jgi:GDP-L-fucose synthase
MTKKMMFLIFLATATSCIHPAMDKNAKIFVAGHNGLVGSAIVNCLQQAGYTNIITKDRHELDLCNQQAVNDFFATIQPEYVFLAAAKVGGIKANSDYPAEFIYQNLSIETNVINAAHVYKVKKLLFLGSSCIYPRMCPQPIKEEYLLTGPLEPTNDAYALAKIAGIKLCQSYKKQYGDCFISCMPTNLYGPRDNFDLNSSHVLPALLYKIHQAKQQNKNAVIIWGSGKPYREFLYVDDLADACLFLMNNYDSEEVVNIGTGEDISIVDLAVMIKNIVGYQGTIENDFTKPDGTPKKQLNVTKLNALGWKAKTNLHDGIQKTYEWCLQNKIF